MATLDTSIYTRAVFDSFLEREWYSHLRQQQPLSLLLIDTHLDALKNGRYEDAVKQAQHIFQTCTYRRTDLVGKLDDQRYIIGLFHINTADTELVLNRLIAMWSSLQDELDNQQRDAIFISCGSINVLPNPQMRVQGLYVELERLLAKSAALKSNHYEIEHISAFPYRGI